MGWRSGQSYSQDLRDRVLGAVDGGMAVRQAALTFSVSIAYIYKALSRRRVTGDACPAPRTGHRVRKLTQVQEGALADHVRALPGVTLVQTQAWLLAEHGVTLRMGALWQAMRRLGLSFKKSPARSRAGSPGRGETTPGVAGGTTVHRS